ncbi:MAG: response regulator [Bacteroidales bacterium]
MDSLKILIVDDHALFRSGLKNLLSGYYPNSEIQEATDGTDFFVILQSFVPDLVFMDIDMPLMDGISATKRAMIEFPAIRIVALSMYGDDIYYYKMVDAGAKGFLLKNSDMTEVIEAIETVIKGDHYFSKELLLKIVKNLRKSKDGNWKAIDLSEREMEILELICKGNSNQEIGEKLFLSKRTIDKHRANILEKTDSKNTAQLVMNAIKNQWILV